MPGVGIEPTRRIRAEDFKSSTSTNFVTRAKTRLSLNHFEQKQNIFDPSVILCNNHAWMKKILVIDNDFVTRAHLRGLFKLEFLFAQNITEALPHVQDLSSIRMILIGDVDSPQSEFIPFVNSLILRFDGITVAMSDEHNDTLIACGCLYTVPKKSLYACPLVSFLATKPA